MTPDDLIDGFIATGELNLKGVPLPVIEALGLQGSEARAYLLGAPVGVARDPNRACGPCTACCSALGIEISDGEGDYGLHSFVKSAGGLCQFERPGQGCCEYERRPLSCRIYACWWRRGWSAEGARPDRLKVIVDNGVNLDFMQMVGPIPLASVAETEAGVFAPKDTSLEKQHPVIVGLADERLVLCRWWGDEHPTRMYGPPHLVAKVREGERRMGLRP